MSDSPPTGASAKAPIDRALLDQVEAYLADFLDERRLPNTLDDAIRYALFGPGKRLRPMLTLYSCQAVGADPHRALPAAAAIEMIHCFSLVHDDLPAMDDDDLRRGRPTLHVHADEATAILAGDAMTSLPFELLTRRCEARLGGRLTAELSSATTDMIAGQVYDTLGGFDDSVEPLERLHTIHRHKTGALIRCACRMGGFAGGGSETQLQALSAYAEAIGLMFQAVDDLLDVTQSTEHLGKSAGKDQKQGKLTYPALLGMEETRRQIEQMRTEAHAALRRLRAAARGDASMTRPLAELCDYMAVRSR